MTDAIGARSVGARVRRAEDPRILTGRGRYIDDVELPGMLHAAFLRSVVPHGRLLAVDVSAARALPGVTAVFTGEDIVAHTNPAQAGAVIGMQRHAGLAVAVLLLARHRPGALRGRPDRSGRGREPLHRRGRLRAHLEDYEMLEPIVSYEDALDSSQARDLRRPRRQHRHDIGDGHRRHRRRVRPGRPRRAAPPSRFTATSPCPWRDAGRSPAGTPTLSQLTIHTSTQSPHMVRMLMSPQIDVPMEKIRVHRRRRRGRLRAQDRPVPRGRRPGRGQHGPRAAGEVDRGPLRASAIGRPGPRGDGRHARPPSPTTACCSACGWTSSSTPAPTPATRSLVPCTSTR